MAISPESKMRSPDRVLVLSIKDGTKAKNSIGNTDPRLLQGDNKLHAVMDQQNSLWHFKYDMGAVPEPLKCEFTSFRKLLEHAQAYYIKRNIEIKEVKD